MDIPKRNKILLLFVSWQNPIFANILRPDEHTPAAMAKILGVASNTIVNWRKGNDINPLLPPKIFENARRTIKYRMTDKNISKSVEEIIEKYEALYNSNSIMHIYDIAKMLGMSIDICQQIIDEAIYDRLPLYPELYFDTSGNKNSAEDAAMAAFRQFRGLFYAWVARENFWLRCPLRVRYPIRIREGIAIRCKMNLPKINYDVRADTPYWEYDGFLTTRDRRVFWAFEHRPPEKLDYFYFITDRGWYTEHHLTMNGKYITSGQDQDLSIVSGDVYLERIEADNVDLIEDLMHSDALIVTDRSKLPTGYRTYSTL